LRHTPFAKIRAGELLLFIAYLKPPATSSLSPVIQLESAEAKKTAADAMSSGFPSRPSGACDSNIVRNSPSVNPPAVEPSVTTTPGLIELTRILRGPSSFANVRVIASTAALLAL
jgi:hypothetical protein